MRINTYLCIMFTCAFILISTSIWTPDGSLQGNLAKQAAAFFGFGFIGVVCWAVSA